MARRRRSSFLRKWGLPIAAVVVGALMSTQVKGIISKIPFLGGLTKSDG